MTDAPTPVVLTGAEIERLVSSTRADDAFHLETFRLLLAQRQVIALERLADAWGKAVETTHGRS